MVEAPNVQPLWNNSRGEFAEFWAGNTLFGLICGRGGIDHAHSPIDYDDHYGCLWPVQSGYRQCSPICPGFAAKGTFAIHRDLVAYRHLW